MSEERKEYERLCEIRGFGKLDPSKIATPIKGIKLGEVFHLEGVGKVKVAHGKRGLEIQKQV